MPPRVLAGTSGFQYKVWRGLFYPSDAKERDLLRLYAERLPAVEINSTFYRLPALTTVQRWAEQVPSHFAFAVKAPRRITHQQRLVACEANLQQLLTVLGPLKQQLAALLFQLPPFQKKDLPRLRNFLTLLPPNVRGAFEFRHPSWFDAETYELLRANERALCVSDVQDESQRTPWVATANWGYVRLRRDGYSAAETRAWAARIAEQSWRSAYVFVKHEAWGPACAQQLVSLTDV